MRNQQSIQIRDYKKPLKNCKEAAEYINRLPVVNPGSKEAIIQNSAKNIVIKKILKIDDKRAKLILQILANHGYLYRKQTGSGKTSQFFKKKNLTERDVIEASQY